MTDPGILRCQKCGREEAVRSEGTRLVKCPGCNAHYHPRAAAEESIVPAELAARFEVGRVLGQGGMGIVYHAVERATGEPRALKILTYMEESVLPRFLQEGELQRRIAHPNLVKVLEVSTAEGRPVLVCEYLDGGTLRMRLQAGGRLPLADALRIGAELLSALEALHAHGVVHRDVKPENVMFDAAGTARLGDLGVAKYYGEDRKLTQAGMVIGTPRYMPPEVKAGHPAVVASDIYSAGLVLHEMITGGMPDEESASALPPELKPVLARMLAKRADARPATAADCLAALASARERARRIAESQKVTLQPAPPRGARRMVVGVATALMLAVVGAVVAPRSATSPPEPLWSALPPVAADSPARALARDIVKRVAATDVPAIVARLVRDPAFDRTIVFPELRPVELGAATPASPRAPAAAGVWRAKISAELARAGLLVPLDRFRPLAAPFWNDAAVPLAEKLALYHALLALDLVESVAASQFDPERVGVEGLAWPFLETARSLTRATAPPPGARMPFPGVTCWVTDDFRATDVLFLFHAQQERFLAKMGAPPPDGYRSAASYRARRSSSAFVLPPAGPRGRLVVGAYATPGPAHLLEVHIRSRAGGDPVLVRLRQPGTQPWLALSQQLPGEVGGGGDSAPWGLLTASLPADALPRGPVDLEVACVHPPGVRFEELVSTPRPLYVGRLWLAGE